MEIIVKTSDNVLLASIDTEDQNAIHEDSVSVRFKDNALIIELSKDGSINENIL